MKNKLSYILISSAAAFGRATALFTVLNYVLDFRIGLLQSAFVILALDVVVSPHTSGSRVRRQRSLKYATWESIEIIIVSFVACVVTFAYRTWVS